VLLKSSLISQTVTVVGRDKAFCGFKDMDAERDKAFLNEDTDSITF
jgi:hypothetical protein